MELIESVERGLLEDWTLAFPPAQVALCALEGGDVIRETSLVAAKVSRKKNTCVVQTYLAAGAAAREYTDAPDTVVFSPLRQGQVASYDAVVFLLRSFLCRLRPGFRLPKPVLCLRIQEQATEVERIALVDAGIQAGAGKVLLYQGSLSALREAAAGRRDLRRALACHIEI
nr:rod shape-determining protein [uncultured Oscillibacter sp.]